MPGITGVLLILADLGEIFAPGPWGFLNGFG
jgi:hypothetical protein